MADDAFAEAMRDLLSDPTSGRVGTFTYPGGSPVVTDIPCVLWRIDREDREAQRRGWKARLPCELLVANPVKGTLVVDSDAVVIRAAVRDGRQLVWDCDADTAP